MLDSQRRADVAEIELRNFKRLLHEAGLSEMEDLKALLDAIKGKEM